VGNLAKQALNPSRRYIPYLITFGAEALVITSLALTLKISGMRWGAEGFAIYALFRRVVALILPALTLGVEVALPRAVAMAGEAPPDVYTAHLLGAFGICFATALLFVLIVAVAGVPLAAALFGTGERADWLWPLSCMLGGYGAYTVVYAYWRGSMVVGRAALASVLALAVVPLVMVAVASRDVFQAIQFIGYGAFTVAVVFFPFRSLQRVTLGQVHAAALSLGTYGAPRFVGSLALLLLFALPTVFAARAYSIATAGVLALGVTIVGALGSAINPVGTILLPRASRLANQGTLHQLRREMQIWTLLLAAGGTFAAIVLGVLAEPLLRFFAPLEDPSAVLALRCMLSAVPGFLCFSLLRHVIDAKGGAAYNTGHALVALLTYLVAAAALTLMIGGRQGIREALSLGVALTVLGWLTCSRVYRLTRE
jgi:O-antigen/teichoic acid export membrane protein